MIHDMIYLLIVLVFIECLSWPCRTQFNGFKTFDWLGAIQHLVAAMACLWIIHHAHSLNTGHLLALLAIVSGLAKGWFYRLIKIERRHK